MRAPRECASWFWDLEDHAPPGLRSALLTASKMVAVLRQHDLLEPRSVEWPWFMPGTGGAPAVTRLQLTGPLDREETLRRIQGMHPSGFPDAVGGDLLVAGPGIWLDEHGRHAVRTGSWN
jgi:hypothetical protein